MKQILNPKFKYIDNLLWPAYDTKLLAVNHLVSDLDMILKFVDNKKVVVQAGGACGIWPKELSNHFNTVYTFEPDSVNFTCMCHNIGQNHPNIIRIQAALGNKHKLIGMNQTDYPQNAGAQYVDFKINGVIPTLKIDNLGLDILGLIMLDIEGMEYFAIRGATKTIAKCRPIIVVEEKPLKHMDKLNVRTKDAHHLILDMGYRLISKIHKDNIYAPV